MSDKRREEAKFTTSLQKWLKHYHKGSGPIEVKVSYDKLFNYKSGFKPHQLNNLINAMSTDYCQTYKISDMDRLEKPYDLVCFFDSFALVVINWVGSKKFYMIDPRDILTEIEKGVKSMSEEVAESLAYRVGILK